MPTNFDDLEQTLENALSSAQNHAAAATGTQGSSEALTTDLALLVGEIDALRKDLDRSEQRLVTRDREAIAAIQSYQNGIADVTEDVAPTGALAHAVIQQLKDDFVAAAGATPTEADLRQAVRAYDQVTDELADDAITELQTRLAMLQSKEETLAEKRSALEDVEARLHEMASLARRGRLHAQAALDRFEAAMSSDEFAVAIVHLQDFITLRERLGGSVKLPPDAPQFDADAPNDAIAAMTAGWETARDDFHTALSERFEAHLAVVEQKIVIAELEGAARLREARRLVDAAAAVDALLTPP